METYAGNSTDEGDEACTSEQKTMMLRNAKILCRIAWDMTEATVDRLLHALRYASLALNVFSDAMLQTNDYQELVQRKGEQMIVANDLEKRTLKKIVTTVQAKAGNHMGEGQEVLGTHFWPTAGSNDLMS